MKRIFLKAALGAALTVGTAPAFADLIYVNTSTQNSGTGLGAVSTVTTAQDNFNIQSACVTYDPTQPADRPSTACQMGLLGEDNTAGNAGNNTYFLNDLDAIQGLTNAGELGFVVNISEGGPGTTATLTDIYLSLFNTLTNTTQLHAYTGPDLILGDTGGIGQSGTHRFVLNAAQALSASAFCPVLAQCVVGGGFQFLGGTTSSTPETIYVGAFSRDTTFPPNQIPEPGSLALLGIGTLAFGMMRRHFGMKR